MLSRGRTKKALIRLHGCVGWSAPLIFECNYVRFSLDTALKYDNCHYNTVADLGGGALGASAPLAESMVKKS